MSVINHIGAADIVSEIEPCLVRLKPSNNPIYRIICFPHGGGSAQAFEDWVAHVPDGVELVAVQAPGRAKRFSEPNLDNMDDLVDLILPELETLNDCPLVFFGHSAGALVAFETTRRLEDEGNGIAPFHLVLSAHKAAHIPPDEPLMHLYSDEALGSLVGDLGLVPGETLADSEFLAEILLPPVRADFKLAETYDCSLARPLNAAITAMGGNRDPLLGATDLWEWQSLTNSRFDVVMFEGNHFYTQSQCKNVLDAIQSSTQEVEKALPRAITFGETAPYPKNPLHVLLRRQASQTPNAPALISPDETFSFAELDHWSDALALQLTERGVAKGSAVGVLFETSPQYVVAIFAALKAGGAYCVIDPTLPKRAIEKLVEHAQMSALLTSTQLSQKIPHSLAEQTFILGNGKEELPHVVAVDTSQLPIIGIDDPAQIVFSSGTTGKPKGIVCPHRSALSSYQWRYDHLPYEEDEREAFNIFLVWEVMRPLLLGRVAYLIPDTVIYDPYQLADYLIEHKITRVLLTPSLLSQFLSSKSLEVHRLQKTLRIAYLNGEVVSDALLERARMMLPQVRFINDYSIAETHDVSHCEVGNVPAT